MVSDQAFVWNTECPSGHLFRSSFKPVPGVYAFGCSDVSALSTSYTSIAKDQSRKTVDAGVQYRGPSPD